MATNPFLDVLRIQMQMAAQRKLQQQELEARRQMLEAQLQQERELREKEMEQMAPVRSAQAAAAQAQAAEAEARTRLTQTQADTAIAQQHMAAISSGATPVGGQAVRIRTSDGIEYEASPESLVKMEVLKAQVQGRAEQELAATNMRLWGFDPDNPAHRGVFGAVTAAMKPQPGVSPEVHLSLVQGVLAAIDDLGPNEALRPLRTVFEKQAKTLAEQLEADRNIRAAQIHMSKREDTAKNYAEQLIGSLTNDLVQVQNEGGSPEPAKARYQVAANLSRQISNDPTYLDKKMDSIGIPNDPAIRNQVKGRVMNWISQMMAGDFVDVMKRN